ncbi:MAG: leucine-rich repeat domain-containing protein [Prevotellaceae bacterium]|nr:leucine-rich repeat domain-containing protein [Candidatus Minthosoma equi]
MKKILLSSLLALFPAISWAYNAYIDDISYDVNSETKTAEVIDCGYYSVEINIPSSIEYEGDTYSVTSIGYEAFSQSWYLSSVTIPNSVTSIGDGAFCGCASLTSITIPSSVNYIAIGTFDACSNLTSVTIPNSVISIGELAFYRCASLTSITIPSSVNYIARSAFVECSNLTSINVETGNNTYDSREDCNAIIETSTNTFIVGCKNTVIPSSMDWIDANTFSGCAGLTSITIPSSVNYIIGNPFEGCSITSINVETGNDRYDSREGCNAIIETSTNTLIAGCRNTVIPTSVTSIGDRAFWDCASLTSVTIPNSVTSIGQSAFYGCM